MSRIKDHNQLPWGVGWWRSVFFVLWRHFICVTNTVTNYQNVLSHPTSNVQRPTSNVQRHYNFNVNGQGLFSTFYVTNIISYDFTTSVTTSLTFYLVHHSQLRRQLLSRGRSRRHLHFTWFIILPGSSFYLVHHLISNIQIVKTRGRSRQLWLRQQGVVQDNFDCDNCGNCGYCCNCDCGCGNYIQSKFKIEHFKVASATATSSTSSTSSTSTTSQWQQIAGYVLINNMFLIS